MKEKFGKALNVRRLWYGVICFQTILFSTALFGYLTSRNEWIGWCFAASALVSGFAAFQFHRREIEPVGEWLEKATALSKKEIGALTSAITELAQGNFAVKVESKPLENGSAGSLFAETLNNIAAGVQSAAYEFNGLTEDPCRRLCYVGADSFLEGRVCGNAMGRAVGDRGMVAISTGKIVAANLELRRKGFLSFLRENCPDIEVVEIYENQRSREIAFEKTLQILHKYPRLSGIYVSEGHTPPGVAKAVCQAKREKQVKIIGHDLLLDTMQYIKDGVITATISQDPFAQGHDPIIHLFNHVVDGWQPPTSRMLTRMEIVDSENYGLYWDPEKGLIQSAGSEARLAKPVHKLPAKPLRFVFQGKEDSEFWQSIKSGVLAAAEELKPFNTAVEWNVPKLALTKGDYSAAIFSSDLESLVRERVDGIAMICSDMELIKTINEAVEAGIPVVTANSEPFNLRSLLFTVSEQAHKLMDVSRNLAANAAEVSSATSQISGTIDTVADRSLSQNDRFQKTEKALESLLANINQIHWEAGRSAEAAQNTVEAIGVSTGAMNKSLDSIKTIEQSTRETWNTVKELARHSERIDAVVHLIDDIASRVNVLALNAAIEATRAGEFGRGFMVVSNEVRILAKSTAEASGEIAGMVGEIKKGMDNVRGAMEREMEKMRHSTAVTDEAKAALENITGILDDNRQRMQKIASAISEVQLFSNQVNEAMKNVAEASTQNTESIKGINTAAEALNVRFMDVENMAVLLEKISRGEQELLAKFTLNAEKIDSTVSPRPLRI
jgi:methyl-accepting chemotaxis protein